MSAINDMDNEHRLLLKAKCENFADGLGLVDAKNRDAVAYLMQDAYALGQKSAQTRIDRAEAGVEDCIDRLEEALRYIKSSLDSIKELKGEA